MSLTMLIAIGDADGAFAVAVDDAYYGSDFFYLVKLINFILWLLLFFFGCNFFLTRLPFFWKWCITWFTCAPKEKILVV